MPGATVDEHDHALSPRSKSCPLRSRQRAARTGAPVIVAESLAVDLHWAPWAWMAAARSGRSAVLKSITVHSPCLAVGQVDPAGGEDALSHGDGEGELAVDEVGRLGGRDLGDGAGAGGQVGGGGGVFLLQAELGGEGSGGWS